MDYLNAYCWLITTHEKAEQFKSRVEYFLETEREVDETSEEGNSLQVIYYTCTMKNNLQTRMH